MDFSWTDEQLAFRNEVIAFAQAELNQGLAERDRDGTFSREQWEACARFGIQGLATPAEYGGRDCDILTATLVMEALGYGCRDNGLTFGLNAQMWTVQLSIQNFGSDAQKSQYLPGLCDGSLIGAHGITEPEAGSDLYSLRTTAEKCDGGYVLRGEKAYCTFGPIANVYLIFANARPDAGSWGITAFLVDDDNPGVRRSDVKQKMGLRTVPMGEFELVDCFVPESARLGGEGAGGSISNSSLEWERACILASQVGAMERQLEESVAYARKRKQFGQPIGKFQAVSHRIAEMKVRLEAARLLLYKVAWLKSTGKSAVIDAAIAKLFLSEAFVDSSLDAIRVHGGRGYLTESGIEPDLRDAVGGVIYGGTSDIQRNVVARLLGL
ncbi:MAG: acyl-CoA dehydrogenase [Phycisphaeraceae bacterium]|nr:acyl-CoA dehydrogenase [Phycisphaeraceae bacterium]